MEKEKENLVIGVDMTSGEDKTSNSNIARGNTAPIITYDKVEEMKFFGVPQHPEDGVPTSVEASIMVNEIQKSDIGIDQIAFHDDFEKPISTEIEHSEEKVLKHYPYDFQASSPSSQPQSPAIVAHEPYESTEVSKDDVPKSSRGESNSIQFYDEFTHEKYIDGIREEASKPDELEEVDVNEEEPKKTPKLDENNPLNDVSIQQLNMLMRQMREMVGMMEAQWLASKKDFKLTDTHMKLLYQYNLEHRVEMPADLSEEESIKWDHLNGLDSIPEEKVLEIFGEEHPIIGVQHSLTIDRIKSVSRDFFSWMSALREYRQVSDGYMELLEAEEEKNMAALKAHLEKEEDPEKKANMQKAVDLYYYRIYLDFLADPLPEEKINRLVKLFSNQTKIEYLLKRSREKLTQMKISTKFILEISQFEKRFLPEKYHHQSNIFLLYFMNTLVYCDINSKISEDKNNAVCMIFGMDKFIRNIWKPEIKEKILNNMIAFQDQFLGKLPLATEVQ